MDLSGASVFVTGGAGTLGKAIAARRRKEGWRGKFTVFSTDTHKHGQMHREYPDINFVQGDIRDPVTLYNAMVGHDVVIHAAAVKVIPASEFHSIDTYKVNVQGSLNVCETALRAGVAHVLGISTDKACHPINAYGATKYMMEKTFQEYARMGTLTEFHLVRYGNVLESNGSVLEVWENAMKRGEHIKLTDPRMTRFWISPRQAVCYVLDALAQPSGMIYVPKMKALSIEKLADYTVGKDVKREFIGLRPGEKMDECLLTEEEGWYATENGWSFLVSPTTSKAHPVPVLPYTSDIAPELTSKELAELLKNV